MPLVDTRKMFKAAYEGGFAIGAFNFANMEVLQGIIEGAKQTQSPLILQLTPDNVKHASIPYIIKLVDAALVDCDLPVALHLDHGDSFDLCKQCIDAGFTSVMIDGSSLPYAENVAIIKQVSDYAHANNPYIPVEAELGKVGGVECSSDDGSGFFTDPDQAVDFVEKTKCDSLAIAVGTKHGAFKAATKQAATIQFDLLAEISKRLADFPLVLHGSSAVPADIVKKINDHGGKMLNAVGIQDEPISKSVTFGVCKINIDTDLRMAVSAAIRKVLFDDPGEIEPMNYMNAARDAVCEVVKHKNEILGCVNKASVCL